MKKRIALLLSAVLAVGTLATACGGDKAAEVKVGLGLHTDYSYSSKSADPAAEEGKQDGKAQADLHIAAVTLDADGKIVSVKVDAIQVSSTFDVNGKLTSDPTTATFKTKRELGNDYNMKGVSASMGKIEGGAEWFEQANAFEEFCKGKTADQVAGSVTSEGYSSDEQLLTGCTMKVNGMAAAVVKACKNAEKGAWKASSTDTLNIGITATIDQYADAAAADTTEDGKEVAGKSRAYANFVAVTSDKDGKITCCVLDSVQAAVTWDTTGKLTSNLTEDTTTKYDLKEGYNMKGASAGKGKIEGGAEWYEQADAFMGFVVDKTSADVKAIAVDESGYPTDEQLTTGCTMKIAAYIEAVTKALAK